MKLDDWIVRQHITVGDWLAAANAVATLHGLPQLSPSALPSDKITVHFSMSADYVALAINGTRYMWTNGHIYSIPSLVEKPWLVVWTVRTKHEVERMVNP